MKRIFLTILLLIPFVINANECDYKREVELNDLAGNIKYETIYDYDNNEFDINFYNVVDGLYLSFNNGTYFGDDDNRLTINDQNEGTYLTVIVRSGETSCFSSIMDIYVILPYYNKYFGSEICKGYEEKINVCSSEFLSYKVSKTDVNKSIESYKESLIEVSTTKKEEENNVTFTDKAISFFKNFGIKIVLVIVSSLITIAIFNIKFRKIKHGI